MPINETVYLHRNHRVCIGKNGTQKIWNKYSFWTHSSDVWFDDGTTLESKMSGLKGITGNIDSGAGYAADVTLVKAIRDSLKGLIDNLSAAVASINSRLGGLSFYEDSNGKWVVGADSVPKKLGSGGLDGLKKVVYRQIRQPASVQNVRMKKTVEHDGNWIVYTENLSIPYDGTQIVDNWERTVITVNHDVGWGGGSIDHTVIGYKFHINNLFPSDYRDWTSDNFYFVLTDYLPECSHGGSNNTHIDEEKQWCDCTNRTYNSSNGILEVPRIVASAQEGRATVETEEDTSGHIVLKLTGWELLIIG